MVSSLSLLPCLLSKENPDRQKNHAFNSTFHEQLHSVQYNTYSTKTSTIKVTLRERSSQELDLESLQLLHWHKKLCFIKFKSQKVSITFQFYYRKTLTMYYRKCQTYPFEHKKLFFQELFFQLTTTEWKKLDIELHNARCLSICKKNILQIIQLFPNSVHNHHYCKGIKLISEEHTCSWRDKLIVLLYYDGTSISRNAA